MSPRSHTALTTFAAVTILMALAAGRAHATEITGTIKSVDLDRNTFVVTVGDADTRLEIDKNTVYEEGRGSARKQDVLQSGVRVTVEYSGDTATRVIKLN